jgi:hypothetical protein
VRKVFSKGHVVLDDGKGEGRRSGWGRASQPVSQLAPVHFCLSVHWANSLASLRSARETHQCSATLAVVCEKDHRRARATRSQSQRFTSYLSPTSLWLGTCSPSSWLFALVYAFASIRDHNRIMISCFFALAGHRVYGKRSARTARIDAPICRRSGIIGYTVLLQSIREPFTVPLSL